MTKLLPSKEKPSSGWVLVAVLLAIVAAACSMCQTYVDKTETEEIKMENRP